MITGCPSLHSASHEIEMVAELPAIAAHFILEIVRGMSYEEVNVGIAGFSTPT